MEPGMRSSLNKISSLIPSTDYGHFGTSLPDCDLASQHANQQSYVVSSGVSYAVYQNGVTIIRYIIRCIIGTV